MKIAIYGLVALVGVMGVAAIAIAAVPDGKVAVVRVTAVDGLAHQQVTSESRTSAFSFDGSGYSIDSSALGSLDNVQTLVLIDRSTDEVSDGSAVRKHSQEVRSYSGTSFEVTDLKGKVLSYQVASIGGNVRLLGDGDQILATGGAHGPYQIWKITGIDIVDKDAVSLR
jgi:hypothetical protein